MKPTLLLLSLVAIALISGTEGTCRNFPCYTDSGGVCRNFPCFNMDQMDDEDVGNLHFPPKGHAASHVWYRFNPKDEMDDDEDECSTANFDRVLVATAEITGQAPNPACARAVFDKICDQCEDNLQCYFKLGREVGPKTPQCQPRRLRSAAYSAAYSERMEAMKRSIEANERRMCKVKCRGEFRRKRRKTGVKVPWKTIWDTCRCRCEDKC